MSQVAHVGVDLAWSTNARTGLAVVDENGALVDSATLRTTDEILEWLSRPEWAPTTIAVDAPLMVTNATGQRECERLISRHFGRYLAYCHSSNLGRAYFNPPRASVLAERLGWNVDPAHRPSATEPSCIEVYPHTAMVGLFELGSILPYKAKRGRSVESRRQVFADLIGHLETIDVLRLDRSSRWADLRSAVAAANRQMHLERVEDEIDAVLCAHLAWLWSHHRDLLQVYGDVESGYIVAPPPPTHPPATRGRATSSG